MRVLPLIIISVLVSKTIFAQEVPTPPETPITYNTVTSSSSESITITDADVTSSSSSSVYISDTNKTYKFKAKFNESKKNTIASKLKKELNSIGFKEIKNELVWVKYQNEKAIFECVLSENKLKIFSNKKELSKEFNSKIKILGKQLRGFISNDISFETSVDENTVSLAEKRVERAKAELEKSIKNLEKAKNQTSN